MEQHWVLEPDESVCAWENSQHFCPKRSEYLLLFLIHVFDANLFDVTCDFKAADASHSYLSFSLFKQKKKCFHCSHRLDHVSEFTRPAKTLHPLEKASQPVSKLLPCDVKGHTFLSTTSPVRPCCCFLLRVFASLRTLEQLSQGHEVRVKKSGWTSL